MAGETTHSDEWQQKRDARENEKVEAERVRIARLQPAEVRNRDWLTTVAMLQLNDRHRQEMLDRGWTPELIEQSNARSTSKGRVIPITTVEGLMVGSQAISSSGKLWYGAAGTNQLSETGELPLAVIQPPNPHQTVDKLGQITGYIAYTESACDKPWLCAQLRNYITIGSTNIGSQPKDLERSIATIKTKYGWTEVKHVLMADGAALVNKHVMGNYRKLNEQIKGLGGELLVGWWGQYTKSVGDIDEISVDVEIKFISFEKFERYGADRQQYLELTQLSIEPTEVRDERFLSAFSPSTGKITFVSSACATGKTQQVISVVQSWRSNYPDGRIIDVTQLDSIRKSHQTRLKIPEWRVGSGQDDTAINNSWGVSLCVDSLLRLELDSIPAQSLIIIDEAEAVLKHFAMAGTLGGNAASTQAHFTQIIDRVLVSGGAVVCLEDDLTDLSVKGIGDLVNNRYPIELIKNNNQPFKWEVAIGGGDNESYLSSLLGRLANGERVFSPNSSQRAGEALDRLVKEYLPELANKVWRLDSKTSPDLVTLLADPDLWMKDRDVRLLAGSPTIQSGFNLSNNQFDRTVARFTNLDTRAQIQMLYRDRSNAPRDIFTTKRGAEAGGLSRSAAKLERLNRDIAQRASLAHGYGGLSTNRVGDVWNRLNAQFAVRETLSSAYMEDYLKCDLLDRGHTVKPANWQADDRFSGCDSRFKEIKDEILVEENKILFSANGRSLTVIDANAILHSSSVPFEIRQQAKKTILHDELPGVEFSEEFLMETYTRNRGEYLRECKLNFFLDKPNLVNSLDRRLFDKQLTQSHIIHSRVPKLSRKVDLLAPIAKHLEDLASGREYRADDPAVLAIQEWGLKENYLFWALFGLAIKSDDGRNSSVGTVNKILKKLGYESSRVSQVGGRSEQKIGVYQVSNSECPHRITIYQALTEKYKNYDVNSTQFDTVHRFSNVDPNIENQCTVSQLDTKSATLEEDPPDFPIEDVEDVAAALELAVAHPEDYLFIVRSTHSSKLLQAAAQLLPSNTRAELKKLVVNANKEVA